jgi:hypothetical protein
VATEFLSQRIFDLAMFDSPWDNLIRRGVFEPNTGLTHTGFTVQNSAPTSTTVAWDAVTLANGSNGGVCDTTYKDVTVGYQSFTYTPVKTGWRGPLFCRDDLYFDFEPRKFLEGYVANLANYVNLDWNYQLERQYSTLVPIYVAGANFGNPTAANATLTAPVATSELTLEMCETLATNLIYNRATNPDTLGFVSYTDVGPTFTLGIGLQMSMKIVRNVPEWRQDIRWAQPSLFMQRIGATKVIQNFRHLPVQLPRRFTHDGTKYVEVPRWINQSSTKGTTQEINPAWRSEASAPYEAAVVMNPDVMEALIVRPDSQVGSLTFNGYGYQGEWKWITGNDAVATASGDACYDPLHKKGRHISEFIYSPAPAANPKAGALIMFKRCATSYTLASCT